MNYKLGEILTCTFAASPFYEVGKTYEVVKNNKDELCVMGKDGLYDPLHTVISKFRGDRSVKPSKNPPMYKDRA